ncbi:MAG: cupin domain-containing protein [Planctomycetota bacterium]|jgi:mannose-6-phosphate isomerase-like protein (cupin superfamily)
MANYMIARLDQLEPVDCPCGAARRAFAAADNPTATMHLVDISADSKAHYHKKMTEIYLVLSGSGRIELDGEALPLEPMTAVLIKPGCRHRAVGNLRIVHVAVPAFDAADEWL